MRRILRRTSVCRLPAVLLVLSTACSAGDPARLAPEVRAGGQSDERTASKGGLDGPAAAVAQFFNGAFPSTTPNVPGNGQWTTVPAFPNLNLTNTLVIASNPSNDRIYVSSRDGVVVSFDNQPDVATTETFLDIRDRIAVVLEGGLVGLLFHPEFGNVVSPNGNAFYVYYTSHCPLDSSRNSPDLSACDDGYPRGPTIGFFNWYLRLSRFEVFDGTVIGDPSSEQVLFNVRLLNSAHLGGGMTFRDDGHLYLAVGDQVHFETAQGIVNDFEGGVLRFAVDVVDNGDGTWTCPAGSHQPRRAYDAIDEISGRYYCIPDTNPWLDPAGGVFEEYCAIGLRNPHRLAHDPVTNRLWEGDVGEASREEVNIIECGNNYGWPFREGLIGGPSPQPPSILGVLTDPVIDFGRNEAASIIGGYVYRGSRFPELYGRYLAGDFVTNRVWAITLDTNTMTATRVLLTNFNAGNLATWGQDNQGEVFLGAIFSTEPLYTLDRIGDPTPDAPALLSSTGAFSNMSAAAPSTAWVPYALNQPFWSDGASKTRFIAVPNDGVRDSAEEQVAFSETGDWSFPIGTVLMKHFELPLEEANPTNTTRLETRFLVLGSDGQWYGLVYRWRPDQLEADLLTTEGTGDYTVQLSGGGVREQTWFFPSRLDCLRCHVQGLGGAAGPRTHQLNRDFSYTSTGRTDNQLRTWNDLGMFSPTLNDPSIPNLPASPALGDVTAPLQDRARSWLDANCAHCHRPGGANAGFDARFTTPFADQDFLWTPVRDDLGNPGTVVIYPGDPTLSALWQRASAVGPIAMPPLAKSLAEQPAVDLLEEWIERLEPLGSPNSAPVLASPGDQTDQPGAIVGLGLSATDDDGDSLYFDVVGLPAGLTLNTDTGAISGMLTSLGAHTVTASASDGPTVSVVSFEWLVTNASCGDGIPDAGEECDDGNLIDGDGCTTGCTVEFCGDGVVNNSGTETCEPPGTSICTDSCLTRPAQCGDGFLTTPEECDDSNAANGDGCTSSCTLEFCGDGVINNGLETCEPPGTSLCTDTCAVRAPLCGDGFRTPPEACEDGNLIDGDGCTTGCTVEFCGDGVVNNSGTETCEPPGTSICTETCAIRVPLCGDGFQTPPEQCEDGNAINGDGCTANCALEFCGDGIVNNGTEACEPPGSSVCTATCAVRVPLCGDGFQTPPEQCEDGNAIDGDGCTRSCALEFCGDGVINDNGLETCEPPGTAVCTDSCLARSVQCGDGFLTPPEQCEDGNLSNGDGCNSSCMPEFCGDGVVNNSGAEACEPPGTALCTHTCEARIAQCGDGFLTPPEQCEDGNLNSGDGCSATCVLEVPPACGDGNTDPGEGCDDGNLINADGCTSGCALEFCGDGFVNNSGTEACEPPSTALCTDDCGVRATVCGDGFQTPPEQCEDGNLRNGDGCDSICMLEFCGDTIVNNNGTEACEPPGTPTCTDTCAARDATCGDGFLTSPEECEDGNLADGDGCTSSCALEFCGDRVINAGGTETCEPPGTATCSDGCTTRAAVCGDGFLTFPEACEDSNLVNGDGCTAACTRELCGDGIVNNNGTETCEPPNTPLCAASCTGRVVLCGDGFQTPPEQCEDGNLLNGDGCTSSCALEFCGDGMVNNDGAETCEPPGTAVCSDTCTALEPVCGDGTLDAGEDCDDGNLQDGDGCTSTCDIEPALDGGTTMPDGGAQTPDGGTTMPDGGAQTPDGGGPTTGEPDGGQIAVGSNGGCSAQSSKAPVDASLLLALVALLRTRRPQPKKRRTRD